MKLYLIDAIDLSMSERLKLFEFLDGFAWIIHAIHEPSGEMSAWYVRWDTNEPIGQSKNIPIGCHVMDATGWDMMNPQPLRAFVDDLPQSQVGYGKAR